MRNATEIYPVRNKREGRVRHNTEMKTSKEYDVKRDQYEIENIKNQYGIRTKSEIGPVHLVVNFPIVRLVRTLGCTYK